MIYYLSPVPIGATNSGGTRKLWDHVEILKANGRPARVIYNEQANAAKFEKFFHPGDLVVVPEVYGEALAWAIPTGVPRVSFVQNAYLVDRWGVKDPQYHPYDYCQDLIAIMTESEHTTQLIRERYRPAVPIIRTHSSGNGRMGKDGPFSYGPWPRRPVIMYFAYKNADLLSALYENLDLPPGWETESLSGKTDEQIAEAMRTGAIFCAPNREEGMCAPTSEAMISGCVIVAWTGGGTDEYLPGRAWIAKQDNIPDLRFQVQRAAWLINSPSFSLGEEAKEHSDWFQRTYSRDAEIKEICDIMDRLTEQISRYGWRNR